MSNSLQPGDLAIIIKSQLGLSIGRIVECVQIDGRHSKLGIIWLVKSNAPNLISEFGGKGNTFHVPQDWLRKISPPDDLAEDWLPELEIEEELFAH
jgi:hypothetical protein